MRLMCPMNSESDIPIFPRLGAAVLGRLPLVPVQLASERLVAGVARRHPSLFARLGEHARKTVAIDPTDTPMAFLLTPDPDLPRIRVVREAPPDTWDARIAGPLAALLGLVHGAFDGDALFFSRDIVIEGDTGAVLALRNAIDNAELDMGEEIAALFGPAQRPVSGAMRLALPFVERATGVALTRRAGEAL